MLAADSNAGVDGFHDHWTFVRDAAGCGSYGLTVGPPDRDDQVSSQRVENNRVTSPVHERFFYLLLSSSILTGVRWRTTRIRIDHNGHSPSIENIGWQNL